MRAMVLVGGMSELIEQLRGSPADFIPRVRWVPQAGRLLLLGLVCGLSACDRQEEPANKEAEAVDQRTTAEAFDFEPLNPPPSPPMPLAEAATQSSGNSLPAPVRLVQVQRPLGIQHRYENGAAGKAMIVETIGAGCGWLDFDRDGLVDLYLNQGGDPAAETVQGQPLDALFQQVLEGEGQRRFQSVESQARIVEPHYSQGVAIADFDNDGWQDIYVTNLGGNTLWWNCGDGTFLEIAQQVGVQDPRWSTSAGWGDLDGDGDLDLYVCNYCNYDPRRPTPCKDREGRDTLCNPAELEPVPDACFINQGDGTFQDQAVERGLQGPGNRALGVAIADFDNDGWSDVYVANDTTDNFLFINDGSGNFVDEATIRGCAVDRAGGPQGSMGVAVADYDGNGFLDLYVTHFYEESNTLYANFGERGFQDATALAGLHQPTLSFLGFGAAFADLNLDGMLELLVANGHVDHSPRAADPAMRPQLFSWSQAGRWIDVSDSAGDYFQQKWMGRGVAIADFDLDGDPDLVVSNENAETVVLENLSPDATTASDNHWLQVSLVGTKSNRQAIGTRVDVSSGNRRWVQELCGGTSFAASHESKLFFGLGSLESGRLQLQIRWPDGRQQTVETEPDVALTLVEP